MTSPITSTTRFNTFNGSSFHAGPRPGSVVPAAPGNLDTDYDVAQILTAAQIESIHNSGIMAFHTFGDSGTDDHHNGDADTRLSVAEQMEAECTAKAGQPDNPCFCFHLGDVIYPSGNEHLYEEEFYQPYRGYGNAILAIPGNHDYYGDRLASFAENFNASELRIAPGTRPAMNLPWFYFTLQTPVATIIGLATVSNNIDWQQRAWFCAQMKAADPNKALIVATHYAPYCFDGTDNSAIRDCLEEAITATGRKPDLVIAGHSHTYQRMTAPDYPVLVIGTGGVGTSHLGRYGNGATWQAGSNKVYGAVTLTLDANAREIRGAFTVGASTDGSHAPGDVLDRFHYPWNSQN
ncbi:metallophosphoesterase family protein [Primorskyibacter sp. 2E107]|uniref:metallophosphoesterase family protein n=1 Tax=Primorskyibacter sp. 2E107 TaxID=3403458 RepID=UPI003AF74433